MDARLFKINALPRSLLLLLIGGCIAILCESTSTPVVVVVAKETESTVLDCAKATSSVNAAQQRLLWRKDGKVLRQIDLGHDSHPNAHDDDGEDEFIAIERSVDSVVLREDARITLSKENGSLIFSSVIASDAGQYVCEIQKADAKGAGAGETINIIELQIIEFLKFAPQPTSKNLELGTLGKVHCKAQGTPAPQVKWLKNLNDALPMHVSDSNGTLVFRNVSVEHRGNYTCIATNSQGQISATVGINVVIAPKFTIPPGLVGASIELAETETVYINCQATGDPTPTIQWDKDLKYLNENNTDKMRFHFHANGTLEIRNVKEDDEARYGCTIGSSAGLKREEVLLIVQSKSNSLVTRIIIIIICLAFLYFVLILGLKLCCRDRRHLGKVNLNDAAAAQCEDGGVDGGDGGNGMAGDDDHGENEPWLTEANSSRNPSIAKSKKLRESTIVEHDSSQVADDIV